MLTIFIPLLVDESSFFAHFMCFEVPALVPPGGIANGNKTVPNDDDDDDGLGILDIDDNDKAGKKSADPQELNKSLHELLDGIQEDFYAVVDWGYMHGITERYISGQKADAAGFVRILLDDLGNRLSTQFSRVIYILYLSMKLAIRLKEMSDMFDRWEFYHISPDLLLLQPTWSITYRDSRGIWLIRLTRSL